MDNERLFSICGPVGSGSLLQQSNPEVWFFGDFENTRQW
jgi:hypothetical protein